MTTKTAHIIVERKIIKKFEYILVYRPSYRHNRKIFIVAWITYIYVWQRFERYFSHQRAKWTETKRSFKVRTNEHKRAVKNQDVDKNEIADHCWKNDHEMNWEEMKI